MGEDELGYTNEDAAQAIGNLPDSESDQRLLNLTRMFEDSAIAEEINKFTAPFRLVQWNKLPV